MSNSDRITRFDTRGYCESRDDFLVLGGLFGWFGWFDVL